METEEQDQFKSQFMAGFLRKNTTIPMKYQEFEEEDIESLIFHFL